MVSSAIVATAAPGSPAERSSAGEDVVCGAAICGEGGCGAGAPARAASATASSTTARMVPSKGTPEVGEGTCGDEPCGAGTPAREPASTAEGGPTGRGALPTTRGPGSNDSNPRPKARRFSTFSLSAIRPAVFSAAEVVMKCFPSISMLARPMPCHPEAPFFGAEGSMHSLRISTVIDVMDR